MLDLAEELVAANSDGTLPKSMTLEHIWLDRDGRVKLLDEAVEPLQAHAHPTTDTQLSESLSPVGLFRAVVQFLSQSPEQRQALPAHAADFLADLSRRPDEIQTLVWAAAQLRECLPRTATLSWSDRLVAVGVSAGNEQTLYKVPICLLMLALLKLPGASESIRMAAVFMLAVAMPLALARSAASKTCWRAHGLSPGSKMSMSSIVPPGLTTICPGCKAVLATEGLRPDQPIVCPACWATSILRRPGFVVRTSRLAILSLTLGIASLVGICLTGIPAIIAGAVALRQINRSQGGIVGRNLALGGIVTGAVFGFLCAPFTPALILPALQKLRSAIGS